MKQFHRCPINYFGRNINTSTLQRWICLAIYVLFSSTVIAQKNHFIQVFRGRLVSDVGRYTSDIELLISDGKLIAMFDDGKPESWFKKASMVQQSYNDSIVITWTYDGAVGTQARKYIVSNINSSGANITLHVHTVFYNDRKSYNDISNITCVGELQKI